MALPPYSAWKTGNTEVARYFGGLDSHTQDCLRHVLAQIKTRAITSQYVPTSPIGDFLHNACGHDIWYDIDDPVLVLMHLVPSDDDLGL